MNVHDYIVIIKFFIAGIGVGIGLYLGKYTKDFLLWIKGGIEDGDGILENKELQIAWFSALAAVIIFAYFFDIEFPDALIYSTFGAAMGMYGFRQFSKKGKNDDNDKKEGEF